MTTLPQRAYFIVLITGLSAASVYSAVQLIQGRQIWMAWLGLLLAGSAPAGYMLRISLSPGPVSDASRTVVSAVCGLGVALTMAMNWRYGDLTGAIHLWSGACLLGWFIYYRGLNTHGAGCDSDSA